MSPKVQTLQERIIESFSVVQHFSDRELSFSTAVELCLSPDEVNEFTSYLERLKSFYDEATSV